MSSVNDKMTALANSIRNKTGKTEKLNLDQMRIAVDSMGIKSASGTYTLATDATGIEIDITNIGFVPDLAVVYIDDRELEYTDQITKGWVMQYQPDLIDFVGLADPANRDFTTTNTAVMFRGDKGTYSQTQGPINANYIGKLTNSDAVIIKVGRSSSSYPVIAGTYEWFAYKIWG